jgi:hypothetical protein
MIKKLKLSQVIAIVWLIYTISCFAKYYYEFVINGPWGRNRTALIPSSALKFDDNVSLPATWMYRYGVYIQQAFTITIYILLLIFCLYTIAKLKFSKQVFTLFLLTVTIFSALDIFQIMELAIWQTIIILGAIVSILFLYRKEKTIN